MANEKNLIPLNKRTQRERKEIAKKGALASNKKQEEKRTFRQVIEMVVREKINTPDKIKDICRDESIDIDKAMVLAQVAEALNGNTQAFNTIRDTIGEKPTDKVEVSGDINNPYQGLTTEELKKLINSG